MKTVALAERIKNDFDYPIYYAEYKAEDLSGQDIAVMAVDSMDERIRLWQTTPESLRPQWIIDARMGLEFCRIYAFSTFDTDAVKAYEKSLYPSAEAEQLPCTARAVVYNTFFISSLITSIVKKIITGEDVPFETFGDIGKMQIQSFPCRRK
jgi:hypothetical protein